LKKPVEDALSCPKAPVLEAGELLLKGEWEIKDALSFFPDAGSDLLSPETADVDSDDDGGEAGASAIVVGLSVDGPPAFCGSSSVRAVLDGGFPEIKVELPPSIFPVPPLKTDSFSALGFP
jgi:hypothetical protein